MDVIEKGLAIFFIDHKERDWKNIEYLNLMREKVPNEIQIHFIFDNKLSQEQLKKINKNIIVTHGGNVGKLKAISNASLYCNREFIKVVDYDDCINLNDLLLLNDKLKKIKNDIFIYHTAAKIYKDNKWYGIQTFDDRIIKELIFDSVDIDWVKIPNAQAIYNNHILRKINSISNILDRQTYYDDDFLSIAMRLFTKETLKIDCKPYIQFHAHGQTSIKSFFNKKDRFDFENLYFNLNKLKKINEKLNYDNLGYSYEIYLKNIKKQSKQFGPLISIKSFKKSKLGLKEFWNV